MIIMAPWIDLFLTGPNLSGYPLEAQIEALKGSPNMAIAITQQEIELLTINHTNDLTEEENDYWENIYEVILDLK